MRKRASKFKQPSKKHQPKSLKIIHEDRDIIVIDKPSALLTTGNEKERAKTAIAYLNDYVRKGVIKSRNRVYAVHRLDRETSGIIVFAKHEQAQDHLQDEWFNTSGKIYHAVVHGTPPSKSGKLSSYLGENGIHKMFSTKDQRQGKLAETTYKVIKENGQYSLLELELLTSRKHQCRVQLADIGCPVVGDKKYGNGEKGVKRLTLHASSLKLTHPFSKEPMSFKTELPAYFEVFMKKDSPAKKEQQREPKK